MEDFSYVVGTADGPNYLLRVDACSELGLINRLALVFCKRGITLDQFYLRHQENELVDIWLHFRTDRGNFERIYREIKKMVTVIRIKPVTYKYLERKDYECQNIL